MARGIVSRAGAMALAAVMGASPVAAATFTADDASDPPVIRVDGKLEFGDDKTFVALTSSRPLATVVLNSPGGNLFAGLGIGRAIHAAGYATEIRADATCASACAFAWLGGRRRFLSDRGLLGFHAAYSHDKGGGATISGPGNALVGAYLNQIGLSDEAIIFVTSASPDAMTWTSLVGARRVGMSVDDLAPGGRARQQIAQGASRTVGSGARPNEAYSSLPRTADVDWTRQGEWVQAASRRSLDDAIRVAEDIRARNENVSIFQYQNGWFGVVVGPFSPGRGSYALSALRSAAEVPADSVVTRGALFSSLAWGQPKPRSKAP